MTSLLDHPAEEVLGNLSAKELRALSPEARARLLALLEEQGEG